MRGRPSIVSISVSLLLSIGCSRPESAADRHAADMRNAITDVERDNDVAAADLGAGELAKSDVPASPAPVAGPASAKALPAMPARVVELGAFDGSFESDDPNDETARPEIRVVGSSSSVSSSSRSRKGSKSRGDDTSVSNRDSSRSSALDPDAKKAYEGALASIHAKRFARGVDELTAFLSRWPDHPYAENAIYWRGEGYFAQGEYARAMTEFDTILSRYGSGSKAPDALLKVGMCHERLGATSRANEAWERLRTEFPRSEAAKKIPQAGSGDRAPKGPKESR